MYLATCLWDVFNSVAVSLRVAFNNMHIILKWNWVSFVCIWMLLFKMLPKYFQQVSFCKLFSLSVRKLNEQFVCSAHTPEQLFSSFISCERTKIYVWTVNQNSRNNNNLLKWAILQDLVPTVRSPTTADSCPCLTTINPESIFHLNCHTNS